MGIKLKYPVIRCQDVIKVEARRVSSQEPLGTASPALLQNVLRAVQKEAETQAAEMTMMRRYASPEMAAVLM